MMKSLRKFEVRNSKLEMLKEDEVIKTKND